MLTAAGLVSRRPSPAVVLFGACRRRARLTGARGPAWCSSPSASRQIRGGGGSGGSNLELGELVAPLCIDGEDGCGKVVELEGKSTRRARSSG